MAFGSLDRTHFQKIPMDGCKAMKNKREAYEFVYLTRLSIGMWVGREFNLISANSLRILLECEFAANLAFI